MTPGPVCWKNGPITCQYVNVSLTSELAAVVLPSTLKLHWRACVHKHLQVEVEVNYDSQCLSQEETSNPKKTSFTICSLNNSLSIFWVNFGLIQQLCHRVLFTTETKKRSEIVIMHASHWLLLHGNGGMLEAHSCGILIYLPYHNDRQNVISQK